MGFKKLFLACIFTFSFSAMADDLSLLSGVYRSSEIDGGISETETSIGARYGLKIFSKAQWFVQARLTSTSYSGDNAPDGASGFEVGGGQKYFYRSFSSRIVPYLSWLGLFSSASSANATTETSTQGIFYGGQVGLKFVFDKSFFVDFESSLFLSALNSTSTVKNIGTGDEVKTTRTELYVDTIGEVQNMVVSLGYVL
ncbi:MAG: hypothetical protein AB8G05_02905 [Oligoflexales bacterium]